MKINLSKLRFIIREEISRRDSQETMYTDVAAVVSEAFDEIITTFQEDNDVVTSEEAAIAITTAARRASQKIRQLMPNDSDTAEYGEEFIIVGERIHKNYIKPLAWLAQHSFKIPNATRKDKVANLVINSMVGAVQHYSGIGFTRTVSTSNLKIEEVDAARSAVRAKKFTAFFDKQLDFITTAGKEALDD